MGLLNTLANIGITIGKVALSIITGGKSIVMENGGVLTVYELELNDILFFTKQKNKVKEIHIRNNSADINYIVTFTPSTESKKGEIIWLKAGESHIITDWFFSEQSPDGRIQICQSDKEGISGDVDSKESMLNLSFNKLAINGDSPVVMGGFNIYALNNGIRITCEHAMGLQDMQFCMLRNEKGICMVQNMPVKPSPNDNADETRFYPIDYSEYGLAEGDKVSGVLNINISDKALLLNNCKQSVKLECDNLINKLLEDRNV